MRNNQETNSGAHGGAVPKWKRYIGELADPMTEKELGDYCRFLELDVALELAGDHLHVFIAEEGVRA